MSSSTLTTANTKGNLSWKTTDEDLKLFVEPISNVISATVQRHSDTSRSKGWGLIEFPSFESAEAAVRQLNSATLNNRQVHLRFDQGFQEPKSKGVGIFVGNIPWNTDKNDLMNLFAQFNPQDCVIATNMMGKSRGFSILSFDSEEDAKHAIDEMHLKSFMGRDLECHIDNGQKRKKHAKNAVKSKVFVGNISLDMDETKVRSMFSQAGEVSSVSLKQANETEKLWGIVAFTTDEDAATAIQLFNGNTYSGCTLPLIVRFDRKSDVKYTSI